MLDLFNIDNMDAEDHIPNIKYDLIFCDFVYENIDFNWARLFFNHYLRPNGILISMSDFHSNHRYRVFMEDELGAILVNDAVVKAEWGNHPKDRFHQCFDNVIIYSNGKKWNFFSEKIQVPKKTMTKGLNPSGRTTKTATAWIDDCTLTTTSLERVKKSDGHLVRWQKPQSLLQRIISPFVKEGDYILDPFMGSGSLGLWCKNNGMNYVGIENDPEVFELAKKNIGV
jgi:DNA modification methylase